MGLFSKWFESTRAAAIRLGITVDTVERDLVIWQRTGPALEPHIVTQYSIPRSKSSTSGTWSFLQRLPAADAPQDNNFFKVAHQKCGYMLQCQGHVTDAMRQVFSELAEEYCEDYFEFEANSTQVCIYWEEFGGPKKAQQLFETLNRLSAL